jgi:RimJ/RimL family protein N-acetyltransferase
MSGAVRLRDLTADDLPRLYAWYQQPELWDHLVGDFVPREEAEAVAYMRRWLGPSTTELRLGIEADGRLVGLTFFSPLDLAGGRAELHIMIGEPAERGRGVGRAAVEQLVARGAALGLTCIDLRVLETNAAARAVYDRCGFRLVGPDGSVRKGGRDVAVLLMRADQPSSATT